jgi:hypothetical protein
MALGIARLREHQPYGATSDGDGRQDGESRFGLSERPPGDPHSGVLTRRAGDAVPRTKKAIRAFPVRLLSRPPL